MVKFTKARDELMIDLVKKHKILYDVSDENFKNNILKHKSWEEISAIIGVSVPECKKRWKSLRDQYNKKKRGDLAGVERTNWEYMHLMTFLSDTVEKREIITITNTSTTINNDNPVMIVQLVDEQNTDDEEQQEEEDNEEKNEETNMDEASKEDPLNTEGVVTRNKKRFAKRKRQPIAKIMAKRRQKLAMNEKTTNKTPEVKTATQKFFESMADIVEKLPTHLQAEVRLKVCQTVTEAEIKHHTQHTILYPNLQSPSFSQFSNILELPTQSTQCVSNIEFLDAPLSPDKVKVDLD